jgi:hypothetical protein
MSRWRKARKKPVIVAVREVKPNTEIDVKGVYVEVEEILTREGALYGFPLKDYIIRGVEGEIYPIKKTIFNKTYEWIDEEDESTLEGCFSCGR